MYPIVYFREYPLHSDVGYIGDNRQPASVVRYNEDLLYIKYVSNINAKQEKIYKNNN